MIIQDQPKTYVFLDESGDAGFRIAEGSTPLFCIAAVIFNNSEEITATESVIVNLRQQLNLKATHEFRFSKEPDHLRAAFCQAVVTCPFRIRAIVVDKNRIYSQKLRTSANDFYQFVAAQLLKHNFGQITNAKIYIDGRMDRELITHLKRELNQETRLIQSIKFYDSQYNSIIQLADMGAGSIARSYKRNKKDCHEYRKILLPRIEDIWEFDRRHSSEAEELDLLTGTKKVGLAPIPVTPGTPPHGDSSATRPFFTYTIP